MIETEHMKIGVISDTHSKPLPGQLIQELKQVDLIVHAGDMCAWEDFLSLAKIKDVKGVCGNMDGPDVSRRLPKEQIFSLGNLRIGLYHGEGAPDALLEKVKAHFKDEKVDAVIFGHSHQPFNQKIDGVLYFNPGSPTDDIFAPYRSYGIMEISAQGEIQARIIKVED